MDGNLPTAPVIHVISCFSRRRVTLPRIALPDLLLPLTTGSRVGAVCKPIGSASAVSPTSSAATPAALLQGVRKRPEKR